MSRKSKKKSEKYRTKVPGPAALANNAVVTQQHKDRRKFFQIALVLLGALIGAALTPIGEVAFHRLQEWYLTPDLNIWYSESVLLLSGRAEGSSVRNSISLIDRTYNCAVVTLEGVGDDPNWQPWNSTVESVFMVFLQNSGRSPVTDIKLALLGEDLKNVEVNYTPNLAGETVQAGSLSQLDQLVVSVKTLPSKSQGIVMFKQPNTREKANVSESVNPNSQTPNFTVGLGGLKRTFQFLGAKEVNTPRGIYPLSVVEMLVRVAKMYGERDLRLPTVKSYEPVTGKENGITWTQYDAGGGQACPRPAEARGTTRWSFQFPMVNLTVKTDGPDR